MFNLKSFAIIVLIVSLSSCGGSGSGSVDETGIFVAGEPGVLNVTWVAPLEREDGTPLILSEIETYNVYYGNIPGDYLYQIDNSHVTTDSIYITDFPSGIYYIVVTTVTTDGLESRYSDEVSVQIL